MNTSQIETLAAALSADATAQTPLGFAALLSTGADGAVSELANDLSKGATMYAPMSSATLKIWLAANDVRRVIEDASTDATHSGRSICLTIIDHIITGASFDFANPQIVGLCTALTITTRSGTAAPVLTTDQCTSLLTAAKQPASWAMNLLGFGVILTASDIAASKGR